MFNKLWESKRSWAGYFGVVVFLHIAGIVGLLTAAPSNPAFWSLGLLAYTFGLRHAFDVDHIAAIDNTVRKLLQQNRNPLGVGFFFSLGHSSVVFLMVLAIAFSIHWIQNKMPRLQEIGGVIGTTVSGSFLLIIAVINLLVLINLFQLFRKMRNGSYKNEQLEEILNARGFLTRIIAPLFRFISKGWHLYPLGFLFGLGFDTATEVGLLAISAGSAKSSVSIYGILSLPLLFAASMSLMDTADGMFMTKAYKWAFTSPLRKLYYNVTVTSISVAAALLVGTIELTQVLREKLELKAGFFQWLNRLDFGNLGYALAALFVVAWALSVIVWRAGRIEEL